MPQKKSNYPDLREACIIEAINIIETDGIESLSMREVSRRLGVSHQAPYKHFPSRDHILAEIVRRSFEAFADHLDNRPRTGEPYTDLGAMGYAYLDYAVNHPLRYRLMFGTALPDHKEHPAMMKQADHAFGLLRDAIAEMRLARDPHLDAMFVWSTMHGLASILQMQMIESMELPDSVIENAVAHILSRIGAGLGEEP